MDGRGDPGDRSCCHSSPRVNRQIDPDAEQPVKRNRQAATNLQYRGVPPPPDRVLGIPLESVAPASGCSQKPNQSRSCPIAGVSTNPSSVFGAASMALAQPVHRPSGDRPSLMPVGKNPCASVLEGSSLAQSIGCVCSNLEPVVGGATFWTIGRPELAVTVNSRPCQGTDFRFERLARQRQLAATSGETRSRPLADTHERPLAAIRMP